MTKLNSGPSDLAEIVYKKLDGAKGITTPNKEILNVLFENLFYTSIKTEESEFIQVTITLIDDKNPDPKPPARIVADRWNFVRFKETIPFTVKNLAKLSKAVDPWSSSLAVYYNSKGELFIWGMIDQAIHYQSFLHYEADSGPEQPGLFQASITGVGCIVVMFDYELLATLKQNTLISNYIDVFRKGNIHEIMKRNSESIKKKIKTFIKQYKNEDIEFWDSSIQDSLTQSLSRILLRIQNYGHGGAVLITDNFTKGLDIKYKVNYDRLHNSTINLLKRTIENHSYYDVIHYEYMDNHDPVPMKDYLNESISDFEKEDTNNELKGAIRFVSALSSVDGLVVLNSELKVKGFGAVIKTKELPKNIYISKSSTVNKNKLTAINPNNFGTRHRSMFSYCWNNHGSLGFVISQDGDIRAITTIDNKLIMWENIRVQRLLNSRQLKRPSIESV